MKSVAGLVSVMPAATERRTQLALLTTAGMAGVFALSALGPLQETMAHALLLSDNQMALLQGSALSLPTAVLLLPIGFTIDHYSRSRLVLVCTLLSLIGSVATALAPNFPMLFAARALVGIAVTTISITSYSLLADYYGPEQRGRAKAAVVLGQYAGKSAAFALGGALLAAFEPESDTWRLAMLWLAVPCALVSLLALSIREAPRTGTIVRNPSLGQTVRHLWRFRKLIVPLILGVAVVDFPFVAALTWAAPTFARNFSLSPEKVGGTIALVLLISGLCGPILGGSLADWCQKARRPRRNMLVLSVLMLASAPATLFAVVPSLPLATALLLMFVICGGAALSMGLTLFTVIIPNELRGLCLSIMTIINLIFAGAIGPLSVSLLSEAMGGGLVLGRALAVTCAAAGFISAATFAWASRSVGAATGGAGFIGEQTCVY